jgi:hypothetical protein
LIEQEILHRYQHMDLIAKVILEWFTPLSQARAKIIDHIRLSLASVTDSKMMPQTQANRIGVLSRLNPNPPTRLSNMLDCRMAVQMPHEQTRKTAAMLLNFIEPEAFILQDSRRFTDHGHFLGR